MVIVVCSMHSQIIYVVSDLHRSMFTDAVCIRKTLRYYARPFYCNVNTIYAPYINVKVYFNRSAHTQREREIERVRSTDTMSNSHQLNEMYKANIEQIFDLSIARLVGYYWTI